MRGRSHPRGGDPVKEGFAVESGLSPGRQCPPRRSKAAACTGPLEASALPPSWVVDAVEVGEPAARLLDDGPGREVPALAARSTARSITPSATRQVLPEVAERAGLPAGVGQREPPVEVALAGERRKSVVER